MDIEIVEGFYAINAVVSQFGIEPETLVRYEREGLLHPRLVNDVRFYSAEDLERLEIIRRLTDTLGLNLAGVDVVLHLLDEIKHLM